MITQEEAENFKRAWAHTFSQAEAFENMTNWILERLSERDEHDPLITDIQKRWRETVPSNS